MFQLFSLVLLSKLREQSGVCGHGIVSFWKDSLFEDQEKLWAHGVVGDVFERRERREKIWYRSGQVYVRSSLLIGFFLFYTSPLIIINPKTNGRWWCYCQTWLLHSHAEHHPKILGENIFTIRSIHLDMEEKNTSTVKNWKPPCVGVGTWQFGSKEGEYWGERKQDDINAIVREAVRNGKVMFDTAEAYNAGRSEECIAQALSKCTKEEVSNAVLASKILPQNCKNVNSSQATLNDYRSTRSICIRFIGRFPVKMWKQCSLNFLRYKGG